LKVFCSSSLFSPRSSCSLCWSPIWHSRKYGRRGSPPSPLLSASASEHTRARCGLHARSHERTSVVSPRLRRCFRPPGWDSRSTGHLRDALSRSHQARAKVLNYAHVWVVYLNWLLRRGLW
jgi:hypothetical protein